MRETSLLFLDYIPGYEQVTIDGVRKSKKIEFFSTPAFDQQVTLQK